ncbi:hypothetical protein NQ315_010663 [Exocentrus adspersus]|uniref:CWH43-like N-terminal domain-containing protein n=1 Tax=Exocentrus adspersus TaxID=1586481 RepID=A0AAV8W5N2_9CUCU|nr:hypothetical protein NQ315_010663 [Exocentrus adspersus]
MVPYISDSGALPPESCIFGQCLNTVAGLTGYTMYIRYRYVKEMCERYGSYRKNHRLNLISFYVGLGAATGVSVVANFQEAYVLVVHLIGAYTAFGFGSIYQCLQTVLYYKMSKIIANPFLNVVRIFLSLISTIAFIICAIFATIAFGMYDGETVQNWKKDDNGYNLHQISTVTEWICAGCTIFYLLLFRNEFVDIDVMEPVLLIQDNHIIKMYYNEDTISDVTVVSHTQ